LFPLDYLLTSLCRLPSHEQQAQLEVGPQKVRIQCHRALLGYYSKFFDIALYGDFAEGAPDSILPLPADEEQHVRAFVQWTYTGGVFESFPQSGSDAVDFISDPTNAVLEKLWIFADRILAPKFANDIMRLIMMKYYGETVSPATTELVWGETLPGSKLREFVTQFIQANGPLPCSEESLQEWVTLLAKGGDLVAENMIAGGFHNCTEDYPNEYPDCLDYFQNEGTITALEWCKQKAYVGDKSERTLKMKLRSH
jgi:hypothetical protein